MPIDIPVELKNSLESGDCVLFLGAGIGANLHDAKGNRAPSGSELAEELQKEFNIDYDEQDLRKVAAIVSLRKGRADLENYIRKRLAGLEPDDAVKWLCTIRWKSIFTTNYDDTLLRAYNMVSTPKQVPVPFTLTSDIKPVDPHFEVPVYYLHGTLFGSATPRIIITPDDFANFKEHRRMLFEKLKAENATSPILYIGYSNNDSNWQELYFELQAEYYPSVLPISFRVTPNTAEIDKELFHSKGIVTIDATFSDFKSVLEATLDRARIDADRLRPMRDRIPSDLATLFDKNPAAISRLLASWIYVNQVSLTEPHNLAAFLKGDKPSLSLLSAGKYFQRDVEGSVFEEVLDFATSSHTAPNAVLVTGPAGYGTSTVITAMAIRSVKENAGLVFILRAGAQLQEGDIEYVVSSFPSKKVFFVVDDAADVAQRLSDAISKLKDKKQSAFFLLGERLNEWRQVRTTLRARELVIEPLSDDEITRLLDFLETNGQLNALLPLDGKMRFNAVKRVYNKELLVVLRETTEGRSFDAILEDEYNGIHDELSRRLYLVVCCFYQSKAIVRDNLLAQILKTPLEELYAVTKDPTEGVVVFDCIDIERGVYAARARHRIIAEVVWQRCGNTVEKGMLLQEALKSLNIAFSVDRDAFEFMIRTDRIVDSMRGLEAKMKFFETACKKDPVNAYVRQHYARMLSREGKGEAALAQIDEAISRAPRNRILYHTKATILSRLALAEPSKEIGLRRLVQSETSFRTAIRMHPSDDYSYQGLAQLYREWASRPGEAAAAAEYVAKAEEVINEGLKRAGTKYSLWLESAKLEELFGNEAGTVRALEAAVSDTPTSIISRYLLGRTYRRRGEYQKAVDIMKPVVENFHDEYRVFIEYALCLIETGRPYSEAIALLSLSSLYGLSDARYIATFGGLSFLNGSIVDAQRIFAEAGKHDFAGNEANAVQFRPCIPGKPMQMPLLSGKVVQVQYGYTLLETKDYPRVIYPSTRFGGVPLRREVHVTFELGFTAKGPIAEIKGLG